MLHVEMGGHNARISAGQMRWQEWSVCAGTLKMNVLTPQYMWPESKDGKIKFQDERDCAATQESKLRVCLRMGGHMVRLSGKPAHRK